MSSDKGGDRAAEAKEAPRDFVRAIIDDDLAAGRHTGVVTRFPPEPNGYLHIGHAKAICLNFGIAEAYGGRCHLRFDDTNPTTENPEYVAAIQEDIRWLGFDWGEHLHHASDYFERLYGFAVELIEKGLAYVDSQSTEEIRENRGSIDHPGIPSPDRERGARENLELFRRMRAGELPDGSHVLRAKIDMAAANMIMRDPVLYRIRHAEHYRTGDAWPIYPLYDFAHCLSDAIEHITHSLCTLEFENNREIYDWLVERVSVPARPRQYEFARLNLSYTLMSKRKLLRLVEEGHVDGWDDPRMPTLSGIRRRGVTPEAIRALCDRVGVAKTHNVIDLALLEHLVRDDLNHRAPRAMAVLRPVELVIEDYPEDEVEELDVPSWPHDVPRQGSRAVPFARRLLVERDDVAEVPPPGFHRLTPGREVRLRHAYVVRCTGIDKDASGAIVRVRCSHDPASRGGATPDGRRVPGTIHWVAADRAVPAVVRLYDRLFTAEAPGTDGDFRDDLNPDSLDVIERAMLEPSLGAAAVGDRFQLERQGYFMVDADSRDGALVLNRTVTLRDTWAKVAGTDAGAELRAEAAAARAAEKAAHKAAQRAQSRDEATQPQLTGDQAATLARLIEGHDLGASEARVLATDGALADLFASAVAAGAGASARGLANWIVNELRGLAGERKPAELPFGGEELARLVALVEGSSITAAAAKGVLGELVERGGDPAAIMARDGLEKIADVDALVSLVAEVIAAHPDQVRAFRDGKGALLGFFVGQVMKASGGTADPKTVKALLADRLA